MGVDSNNSTYPVCESVATWGIWCKDIPFQIFNKVKEPAKRSWYDEHGDDEYIGEDGLYLDAYTMNIELGCKKIADGNRYGSATVANVREKVGAFLEYLRSGGMFKIYSSHTRIGRQDVRLESVSNNAKWKVDEDGFEFLVFEITLKVNDPKTDITLTNG